MDPCTKRVLSICSGIGGIELGLAALEPITGERFETVCYVEQEISVGRILAKNIQEENLGMHLSGLICAPSIVNLGAAKWISSLVDSHVSPIARQGSNDTETTQENSAEKSSELPESWETNSLSGKRPRH